MAKSSTIYNYQSITHNRVNPISNGSFSAYATGAGDDSDVFTMIVTNSSAGSNVLIVAFNSNGTDDTICEITIPGNAGTAAGTPAIDLIQDGDLKGVMLDSSGNKFFRLKAGAILKVKSQSAGTLAVNGTQMNF